MKIKQILFLLALLAGMTLQAQDSIPPVVSNPANNHCFSCHGKRWYTYANQDSSQVIKHKMFKDLIIDTVAYYHNNHKSLACTDCHSSDYNTLPPVFFIAFFYFFCIPIFHIIFSWFGSRARE
jgi:nitrate reductase cytochrome c-type subunit